MKKSLADRYICGTNTIPILSLAFVSLTDTSIPRLSLATFQTWLMAFLYFLIFPFYKKPKNEKGKYNAKQTRT
jgi:hypothetical protein